MTAVVQRTIWDGSQEVAEIRAPIDITNAATEELISGSPLLAPTESLRIPVAPNISPRTGPALVPFGFTRPSETPFFAYKITRKLASATALDADVFTTSVRPQRLARRNATRSRRRQPAGKQSDRRHHHHDGQQRERIA